MWYSIQRTAPVAVAHQPLNPSPWEWARKSWQRGHPVEIPRYVSWSKEEWERWIEQRTEEQ